jgi:hypothetical protein
VLRGLTSRIARPGGAGNQVIRGKVRMTPKTLVLIGTLMHLLGSIAIGWSLLEYRWTGQFDTVVRPIAFAAYILGYIQYSWEHCGRV